MSSDGVLKEYYPKPCFQDIPEWYKDIDSYLNNNKMPFPGGNTSATIKKCMPVFDVISSGYFLYTYVDISIQQVYDENSKKIMPFYSWPAHTPIDFHPPAQAETHPQNRGISIPKFINPWSIKTPKGYSLYISQPAHRDLPFTIFPAIVDTDKYTNPINFIFTLNDPNWEGIIPAGTPMAQIMPFKRDSWKMKLGSDIDKKEAQGISDTVRSRFFDVYKNKYRSQKEYK